MPMRPTFGSTLLLGIFALFAGLSTFQSSTAAQPRALRFSPVLSRAQIDALRQAWNERLTYVPGEVLVKFRDDVEAGSRVRALSIIRGGVDARGARWIGDVLWLRAAGEPDGEQLAAALRRQPEVAWAQPNYVRRTRARPNDPSYSARQWNFDLIEMPRAWDINAGANETITIAILDSGFTTVTESFDFPLWTGDRFETVAVPFRVSPDMSGARLLPGRDFMFWDGPVLDMDGHGTHVAGTALEETNNNVALSGIAYRAKLLPLKVCIGYWDLQILISSEGIPGFLDPEDEGFCSDAAVTEAIRYAADNGAQIINLSLGGSDPAPAQREALQYAVARGAFVTLSVGNEFEDGNPVEYPAAYAAQIDGAMSVGAVGRSSQRAYYSNTGSHLEIVAPGGNPRDGNPQGYVWQATISYDDSDPFTIVRPRFDRFVEGGYAGTSMAAPHVAGLAALLYTQGVTRPAAIEAAIRRFATDLGTAGRDNDYGFGLIHARNTLRGLGAAR